MQKTKFYKKDKQFYIVDKDSWAEFAQEMIDNGFEWSGHSKIDTKLAQNHGLKVEYMSGQKPFVVNVYDPEAKLICYSMLEALDPDVIDSVVYCISAATQRETKAHLKALKKAEDERKNKEE